MNQNERKAWILRTLSDGDFESIQDAYHVVGGEYQSLEAMSFGLRTIPNHIRDDYDAGRISGPKSIELLADAVRRIPDEA